IKPFIYMGIIRQTIKHKKPTPNVTKQETRKRLNASSFCFGSITAWLYCNVAPAAIIVETELNEPNTPKSEGEKRRLIIGDIANPIICAAVVPHITIRTFLINEDFLSLKKMCFN
ncbi:MAG: hypothetical protein QW279_08615, partial [Candidatus Jordarchaeaceae archaeon]